MNEKKMRIIQNFDGHYKGVGRDTHVNRVCKAVYSMFYPDSPKHEIEKFSTYACMNMKKNPGIYCNEIIGEFGQIMNRGDLKERTFVNAVFDSMTQNKQYSMIINNWKRI